MSEVYTNSILILLALVATSGDIGLFYIREDLNSVKIPVRRAQGSALDSFSRDANGPVLFWIGSVFQYLNLEQVWSFD